jgi:hypothetical protein
LKITPEKFLNDPLYKEKQIWELDYMSTSDEEESESDDDEEVSDDDDEEEGETEKDES